MAEFKDVFSTTLKVLLALFIISAVIGLGYLILGGVGSIVTSSSPTKAEPDKYQTEGDTLRTTMPKKAWDKGVAKAVKKHCFTKGMNEEEVVRAVGEPTEKSDYGSGGAAWTWQLPPGKCLKYDGDNCTEHEKRNKIIFFTAKGNVYLETGSCETLDGQYIHFDRSGLFESAAR